MPQPTTPRTSRRIIIEIAEPRFSNTYAWISDNDGHGIAIIMRPTPGSPVNAKRTAKIILAALRADAQGVNR